MATARFSCGTSTGRGSLTLPARPRLNASTIGGKSVPGLAKKKSTPCSASERRKISPAIGARIAALSCARATSPYALSLRFSYSTGNALTTGPARMGDVMISHAPIFHVEAELADILHLGHTPYGDRRVINILGGRVHGPRLS